MSETWPYFLATLALLPVPVIFNWAHRRLAEWLNRLMSEVRGGR